MAHQALAVGLSDKSRHFLVNYISNCLKISVDLSENYQDIFEEEGRYSFLIIPSSYCNIINPAYFKNIPVLFVDEGYHKTGNIISSNGFKREIIFLEPFSTEKIKSAIKKLLPDCSF